MSKRATAMLATTFQDFEGFQDPNNLIQSDKVKRDIAYVIKSVRAKKRLKNDFVPVSK
jgi:hypothetical protein